MPGKNGTGRDTDTDGVFQNPLQLSALDGLIGFRLDGVEGDGSGRWVSSTGDTNDDGIDDLIVGAPAADRNGNNSGSSYVVFGRGDALFSDRFEGD